MFLPKKGGSLRFFVDYRNLDVVNARDSYPVPRIDECIDFFGDALMLSNLDANRGYWQKEIEETDPKKTVFTSQNGFYRFYCMLFGLCSAPRTFLQTIDVILSSV